MKCFKENGDFSVLLSSAGIVFVSCRALSAQLCTALLSSFGTNALFSMSLFESVSEEEREAEAAPAGARTGHAPHKLRPLASPLHSFLKHILFYSVQMMEEHRK